VTNALLYICGETIARSIIDYVESDVYNSAVYIVCTIQQGSVGPAAMMVPPTAMFTTDHATASFNGMMPPAAGQLPNTLNGNSCMMMMNPDDDGTAGWSSATVDMPNYLSNKAAHMVSSSSSSSNIGSK